MSYLRLQDEDQFLIGITCKEIRKSLSNSQKEYTPSDKSKSQVSPGFISASRLSAIAYKLFTVNNKSPEQRGMGAGFGKPQMRVGRSFFDMEIYHFAQKYARNDK